MSERCVICGTPMSRDDVECMYGHERILPTVSVTAKDMTLRDYFAGQVLAGLASNHTRLIEINNLYKNDDVTIAEAVAQEAYTLADAILAALTTTTEAEVRADEREKCAKWHESIAEHDEQGMEYSSSVGISIANWDQLDTSSKTHRWCAAAIRAGEGEG